ncbi:MAG: RelA/SpoT domain-containing protein [Nitrospira sp.]|nr:RelA/SpoT domain-containing protein [Nitrospira sp.]
MNLNDYETKYFPIYKAFCETVRFILQKAILAADNLPRPQSIQYRAKGVESLRRRLVEAGKLDTQTLELDRRDLAGARLIFYTNNDVDRFLASTLIQDNFEIEEDSTKIHHPTQENQGARYRAVHYAIQLREERLSLPEYMRFTGLRCEIQVQTILEHAWAETSHDILYKKELSEAGGYGERAMKGIKRRFERIMDDYLVPAGYEMQKAQEEYERLIKGKELFDKDIAILLDKAQNNNERYEILSGLKDYAIPNYNNLPAVYDGLKGSLLRVVKAARTTEPVPIETTYGNMDGYNADAVTRLVVEIIENLRYADVVGTLQLLIDIYRDEANEEIRQQIVNVVKKLSEYNIDAYRQVGPMIQMALVDYLAGMGDAEVDNVRPIALAVWTKAMQSDITGTKWKANSVTLSTGALPASDQLKEVRDKALKALFAAYDRSTLDVQKRAVLSALDAATRTPHQGQYSNQLLAITIKDATRIVEFLAERAKSASYEILQHLEHQFLYDYRRAKELTEDTDNRFGCQTDAKVLMAAILKFRDIINTDDQFVRFKVLVGFESVYPNHWTDEEFEIERVDDYRRSEADRYIDEIIPENENAWFDLMERCAKTKSDDLATFPAFGNFISKLAERKPEVADRIFTKASDDLHNFLPGFLNGLAKSSRADIYERILEGELESGKRLTSISWHLRKADVTKPDFATRLLKRALATGAQGAVTDCLLLALEYYGTEKITDADTFVRDALTFLNDRKDSRWVSQAWFMQKVKKFFEELSPERTTQLLKNLAYLCEIDYRAERVLVRLAERQPEAVWDYLGTRLSQETANAEGENRFEAVPFQFHGLEKVLSNNPLLAVSKGLSWFSQDRRFFQFRGGRLLSIVFPNCTTEFATALANLVKAGGDTEADFALAILQNYDGVTSAHVVLKEIVSRFPDDQHKLNEVRVSIDNTGVVRGEFGFAEALQARKEALTEWLKDSRSAIKAFAEKHIIELDRMIASERRRAESRREMRKRDYEEDDTESNGSKGN